MKLPISPTRLFSFALGVAILAAPALTRAQSGPYLAKPGEAPLTVYVAICATSDGFIRMYSALDQNLFAKCESNDAVSFLFADLNGNWWEINSDRSL